MEPLLQPASALGRPRATDMRTVMSTGWQWRRLPKDFPPYLDGAGLFLRLVAWWNICLTELHSRHSVPRGGERRGEPEG
jgi:hypothetical protein